MRRATFVVLGVLLLCAMLIGTGCSSGSRHRASNEGTPVVTAATVVGDPCPQVGDCFTDAAATATNLYLAWKANDRRRLPGRLITDAGAKQLFRHSWQPPDYHVQVCGRPAGPLPTRVNGTGDGWVDATVCVFSQPGTGATLSVFFSRLGESGGLWVVAVTDEAAQVLPPSTSTTTR